MSGYPACRKCPVIKDIKLVLQEYEEFAERMGAHNLNMLSSHAMGYCQGQLSLVLELNGDLANLIDHSEVERQLRVATVKGK